MSELLHALPQLVENGEAALDQRASEQGRFETLWGAVEQTHAERTLQIGNGFRYHRSGDRKALGCLRHAPLLDDRQEHLQVAQLQAPQDTVWLHPAYRS